MSRNISIDMMKIYGYHGSIVCGLSVNGSAESFPVVVGCSLRSPAREVIDIPARWLKSPGLAIWELKATSKFYCDDPIFNEWRGEVIFAVYRDDSYGERFSDTGWVKWSAPWLIGASVAGLNMQDEEIREIYGERLDVWKPL